MKFKGTATLFVLLLILGGWVYWTDIRGREERQAAEEAAGKVLPVDDADIIELGLTYPDRTVRARRSGDGWEFLEPEGLEAAAGEWDIVAANVGRIDRDETVVSGSADLAQYGLTEPAIRVGVVLADGTREEILFGDENPRGTFDYVKLGSGDEVFLAATSWAGLFEKDTNDLRDKTILRFDQDMVETIEVTGEGRLGLRRDGTDWHLTAPLDTAADNGQVSTLLGAIDFARAIDFADPELGESETGLDMPRWRIVLNTAEGAHELLIGAPTSDSAEQYYARDRSRDPVFVIDSEIAGMLSEPVLEWRDRSIAGFERSAVVGIEIVADENIAMRSADGDWFTEDDQPVDFARVSSMLNALEFGQATEIIDSPGPPGDYGLDDPRLRVILRDASGGVLLEGAFGQDAGDQDHIYWKSSADPTVRSVSKDALEAFEVSPEDLVASPSPEAPAP